MRLRQAHAILEAATALEAAGLGFELWPFDHDREDAIDPPADDYMAGFAEFTDPDMNGLGARAYRVRLSPHADGRHVEATLVFGYGPDAPCLLYSKTAVRQLSPDDYSFVGLVGARLAERIAEAIREHEKPFEEDYARRSRK